MESIRETGAKTIEINTRRAIHSVLFLEDGKHIWSGGEEGVLRRWRVEDGQEVGEPIQVEGAQIYAAALSPDCKWLVCGLRVPNGTDSKDTAWVRVWDARTQKKDRDVQGPTNTVFTVDVSPDSTKFVAGSCDQNAYIWSLTTGGRLVEPLKHEDPVVEVRFSPNGDRIATATTCFKEDSKPIRIYDSNNGQQLLDIGPCQFWLHMSSWLAWSADGRQLYATAWLPHSEVRRFDASFGSQLGQWAISVDDDDPPTAIVLAHNQKFAVAVASKSLTFWDTSTFQQIGTVFEYTSFVYSIVLSPNDDCIATGEKDGRIIVRSLRGILPGSYLMINTTFPTNFPFHLHLSQLPLMPISNLALESWTQGDLTRVEELLNEEILCPANPIYHAHALAYRAFVRTRSKHWDTAIDDAKESTKIKRSVIGYIAHAIALVGIGDHTSAMKIFDLVFSDSLPSENKFLLLIKSIIFFERGEYDNAISRVDHLIEIVDYDHLPYYITVRAQMVLLRAARSMERGDHECTVELFNRAKEAIPAQKSPHLVVISLIFGWNFDKLSVEIQLFLSRAMCIMVQMLGEGPLTTEMTAGWDADVIESCAMKFEDGGDKAVGSNDPQQAITQYSAALLLNPLRSVALLVKRSNARGILGLWEDALKDADDAIKGDSSSPWGYERRYAALHGLERYDEAMNSFTRMHSLIESSPDPDACQLAEKYVSPSKSETAIDNAIGAVSKVSPIVLIDVKSGRLCSAPERTHIFKSEPEFKGLVCSMTRTLDDTRIRQVVDKFFRYIMLSHVWGGKEPLFEDVSQAGSVWELDESLLNNKLRKFCEVVHTAGCRWAWSDTCCIDKTISTVLNQSLKMMYKWYEASAATFVLLADVASPSTRGALKGSKWLTRAWTSQELLAPMVIRFYSCDWEPYLGDLRSNHKDSPEIMEELVDAIGVARNIIAKFDPDGLGVREKLRLASTRKATVDEDVAYSLIGIFKSDILPEYGEGDAALGHLLEEIVTRSGEVMVLAWNGRSSPYNSCLPVSLEVYSRQPGSLSPIADADMDERVAVLRDSLSHTDAILIHARITSLPPARFSNSRLHLPCIIFTIRRLDVKGFASSQEEHYRAKVSGIGDVEFWTSDRLPLAEPRKLIFVHPWIHDLRDPLDGFAWGGAEEDNDDDDSDGDDESDSDTEFGSAPSSPLHQTAMTDDYTRALRLIVRLQQPFHALLLGQQSKGEFKRVAAEHEIVVPGFKRPENFFRDVQTGVVEVL